MAEGQITKERVVEVLRSLDGSRRKNPVVGTSMSVCVYTGPRGNHCIAGHVMDVLGVEPPGKDDPCASTGISQLPLRFTRQFEHDALGLLKVAQNFADLGTPTWGRVVQQLRLDRRI